MSTAIANIFLTIFISFIDISYKNRDFQDLQHIFSDAAAVCSSKNSIDA